MLQQARIPLLMALFLDLKILRTILSQVTSPSR
jgi:hypothetical protein